MRKVFIKGEQKRNRKKYLRGVGPLEPSGLAVALQMELTQMDSRTRNGGIGQHTDLQ